jgi:hypothetical protein
VRRILVLCLALAACSDSTSGASFCEVPSPRQELGDVELADLLEQELARRLPDGTQETDAFVQELQRLPKGLRAMAATAELDASLAWDDLGWHFGNWHHAGLARETAAGLRELEAARMAEIFEASLTHAQPYWAELGSDAWMEWYPTSKLKAELEPLNDEAWKIWQANADGLVTYWIAYARRHADELCAAS